MGYIAQLKPNTEELLAKQEKRAIAQKHSWTYLSGLRPGDAGRFIKGNERAWQTQKQYVRATLDSRGVFVDHKYFSTLEETLS